MACFQPHANYETCFILTCTCLLSFTRAGSCREGSVVPPCPPPPFSNPLLFSLQFCHFCLFSPGKHVSPVPSVPVVMKIRVAVGLVPQLSTACSFSCWILFCTGPLEVAVPPVPLQHLENSHILFLCKVLGLIK